MFEPVPSSGTPEPTAPSGAVLDAAGRPEAVESELAGVLAGAMQLGVLREVLGQLAPATDQGEAVDRIQVLEELKAACAAAQARESVALDSLRRAAEAEHGVPARDRARGVGAEVALARRESAHQGGRHLGLARALVTEMPHTMAALAAGRISEWQATVLCRETAWLEAEHRRMVDELMAPRLGQIGTRRLAAEAKGHAQRLDQQAAVKHLERATSERRVSVRPAPGGMAYLSALLPLPQAVAAYATLTRDAATALGAGDEQGRTQAQLMADTLIERLTGQPSATAIPTEIQLVMSDATLLNGDSGSAWIPGHGPVPAEAARQLLGDPDAEVFIRRLYTTPETGQLVGMDSKARLFPPLLRRMILLRDDVCRAPWCEAPICHADHARAHQDGGPTSYQNGSGLCEACNYTKEHPGWRHQATSERLEVTTPTGHHYTHHTPPLTVWAPPADSTDPPDPPGPRPRPARSSPAEAHLSAHLSAQRDAHLITQLITGPALPDPGNLAKPGPPTWTGRGRIDHCCLPRWSSATYQPAHRR